MKPVITTIIFLTLLSTLPLRGQQTMNLSETIHAARNQSVEALEARQAFISTYWAYRSYQASRLPSFYMYGNLMNFDRSLTLLQNPEDGTLNYVSSNNLQNGAGLQINQNITFTGGTLSVASDLSRIDQFGMNKSLTWYSRPITVSYYQPLFTYNQFKWDKKIEPKEYEQGKRQYLERMESITVNAVYAYHNLLLAKVNNDISVSNFENSGNMLRIAKERLQLGTVTRAEYLQLELRMLNDSIAINESAVQVREAQMTLNSLLGYDESFEIVPEIAGELPNIQMDYDLVMEKSLSNSSFSLSNELSLLNAESDVAYAKASRGFSFALNARFGMSQTGPEFPAAYKDLLDQEVVGITFSIPLFDWGLGKGKVQKAKAAQEVVKAQVQQSENDYRRQMFTAVSQFNNQRQQCLVSHRAMLIAAERYDLTMHRFREGNASVTDLNMAQTENDSAQRQYISDLCNFWIYYYTLRKYTLFDFINNCDLEIDITEMIN
ncbi:MAG: TolC family protein [Bacteroidales bacterium]|nr:TolC family protein [Bacteroidales bacterium]